MPKSINIIQAKNIQYDILDEINDTMVNEKESAIISLVIAGDEAAFAVIVKMYWHNIYCNANTYMKSGPMAEEVTQDIFMRLWDTRSKLAGVNNFENYFFILARNFIISALRKKLKQSVPLLDDQEELLLKPDKQLEYRETYQCLLKGIELLPEKRKQVFRMSRLEGKTHDEIAGELGINKDTVSQYIVKALIFLRNYMNEQSDSPILVVIMFILIHIYTC